MMLVRWTTSGYSQISFEIAFRNEVSWNVNSDGSTRISTSSTNLVGDILRYWKNFIWPSFRSLKKCWNSLRFVLFWLIFPLLFFSAFLLYPIMWHELLHHLSYCCRTRYALSLICNIKIAFIAYSLLVAPGIVCLYYPRQALDAIRPCGAGLICGKLSIFCVFMNAQVNVLWWHNSFQ